LNTVFSVLCFAERKIERVSPVLWLSCWKPRWSALWAWLKHLVS
jgi:hypothetical protein